MEFPESGSLHTVKVMRPQHEKKNCGFSQQSLATVWSLKATTQSTWQCPCKRKHYLYFPQGKKSRVFTNGFPNHPCTFSLQPKNKSNIRSKGELQIPESSTSNSKSNTVTITATPSSNRIHAQALQYQCPLDIFCAEGTDAPHSSTLFIALTVHKHTQLE